MMPDLSALHLMRPEWLWAALPGAILLLLLWRTRARSGGWSSVIAPELLPYLVGKSAAGKRPNLLPVIGLAWLLTVLGAAGPSWQKIPQPIHQAQDALIMVLDLSLSMKAGDLPPSRLDRARQKLLDLLTQRGEGQSGLIAYAGDSHIVTPLTDDNPTISNLLPALNPEMMPVPGSNAAAAVEQAIELLHSGGVRNGRILLITDGIDERNRNAITAMLADTGIHLTIFGVGTATGAPIPLPNGGFLKDRRGDIVIPTLDESALHSLTRAVSGDYRRMQIDSGDLESLLQPQRLAGEQALLALDRTADAWDDQGYLVVLLLLPLALVLFRRGWLICLAPVLCLWLGLPQNSHAQTWQNLWQTADQQGQRALEAGDAQGAAELFDNPDWAGTAAYRAGDYEGATEQFSKGESADQWYNRGNALARSGQLDEALEAYRQSLSLKPEQEDAQHNIDLIEQMKQQQEQEQQQQDQQQKPNDEQQSEDSSEGEESDSQNEPSSNSDEHPPEGEEGQDEPQDSESDNNEPRDHEGDSDNEQPSEPEPQESPAEPEESPAQEEEAPAQPEEAQQEQPQEMAQAQPSPEDSEKDQAMQQWLRRVPDDPSGLLREKFRYESRQRQNTRRDDETYW